GGIRVEIRGQEGRRWAHTFQPGPQWRDYRIAWDAFARLPPWRGDGDPPPWRTDDALQIAFSVLGEPGAQAWFELDEVRLVDAADAPGGRPRAWPRWRCAWPACRPARVPPGSTPSAAGCVPRS